jgi:Cu2+-exporting ATPase
MSAQPASRQHAAPAAETCYHCGQPVAPGSDYRVTIDHTARAMCCRGCQAVAQAIVDGGLADYYRHRTAPAATAREIVPEFLRESAVYDHPEIQKGFVQERGDNLREASLMLENITCAACVWLNERTLAQLPGVREVHLNYSTHRARVVWDDTRLRLSDILDAIARIGYRAHPYDPGRSEALREAERKRLLRGLGVAGLFGMQVMTLAEALYFGEWWGIETELQGFFLWVSLLLTLPVLLYSAQPFFAGAFRDLRHRRAGMDVPIVLGLVTAFAGSLWTTVTREGVAYYDSVTMFVFLLLGARYFEQRARRRAGESAERLVRAAPALATRLIYSPLSPADGGSEGWGEGGSVRDVLRPPLTPIPSPEGRGERAERACARPDSLWGEPKESLRMIEEQVPVAELRPGDQVRVRPGEIIPADGTVLEGRSSVDESLLTGESRPLAKGPGDALVGGAINRESPLTLRVDKVGADTVLSSILRLLDRAGAEKPRLAEIAERIAGRFVAGVLLLAVAVGVYWWQHDSARVLPIVIAVLVITCPCALALATPTALACATGALTRRGLLATRGHALERLARATHFVFDKTGTLTLGQARLAGTRTFAAPSAEECLKLAAALERHSEHPLARALVQAAPGDVPAANAVTNIPGEGLRGTIGGETYYVGAPGFVRREASLPDTSLDTEALSRNQGPVVALASSRALLAVFRFEDALRPGAAALVTGLKGFGKEVWLLTGDHEAAARHVAHELGIEQVLAGLKPDGKLAVIRDLQAQGAVVAMIGDGVNDAPVLAGADVSIAMGNAAHVSAAAADMILLASDLSRLRDGYTTARRTLAVIRQNLAWAVGYNLVAVPAAALGYVSPWLAALGMSLSSLTVVLNALRLLRARPASVMVSS